MLRQGLTPVYFLHLREGEGGIYLYLHFWVFWEEYWYWLLHFLLFLRVFELFFEVFL